jgi:hypothetical protein
MPKMLIFELITILIFCIAVAAGIAYRFLDKPGSREITTSISSVWTTYKTDLDDLLARDLEEERKNSPYSRKQYEQARIQWVGIWLTKFQHNIELFQAIGRREVAKIAAGTLTQYDAEIAREMLYKAFVCRLVVICLQKYFQALHILNDAGWPFTRRFVEWSLRLCSSQIYSYGKVETIALKIALAYGRIYYENLLSAL